MKDSLLRQITLVVSKAQVESFRAIFKKNARPVQPLNGRTIEESK